jgi:putative transposase
MSGARRANSANRALGVSRASRSRPRIQGVHGYDTPQHGNGRKRPSLVDTLGVRLIAVVTAASAQDREGAVSLLTRLRPRFSRLRLIWAAQAYTGDLATWLWELRPWRNIRLEMVKRPEGSKGFRLLPKRWIVERTFGWLGRYRRLSKDDEFLTQTSEAMIRVAMIHLRVRRLARMIPS